jgi:Uma2 family endonuclease
MEKMAEWMRNGVQLGWLIDADNKTVFIFRPQGLPEQLVAPEFVHGEGPVTGFKLELNAIFAGL